MAADYPERSRQEIGYAIKTQEEGRAKLGQVVAGSAPGTRQRYLNPALITATSDGELVGSLVAASNVSTSQPGIQGHVEMIAKAHVPALINKKYAWFGACAVSPEIEFDNAVRVIQVMHLATLYDKDPDQPVSAYPWMREEKLTFALGMIGLTSDTKELESITPFGETSEAVTTKQHFKAPKVSLVYEATDRTYELTENVITAMQSLSLPNPHLT